MQTFDPYLSREESTSVDQKDSSQQNTMLDAINRASTFARNGNLEQATQLLEPLYKNNNAPKEVIDLLAKVYAQQGKIEQAQALWLKILELDPSDLHVLSALKLCAYYQKPKYEHFLFRYSWLLILILLWFIVILFVVITIHI